MRVLITGGAGFVGSHLADRLLARGDAVLVIDNYATGRRDNLPESAPGLQVIEGDIAERATVEAAFGEFGPEVVVHAAASYKDPNDWAEDARTNAMGSAIVTTGRPGRRLPAPRLPPDGALLRAPPGRAADHASTIRSGPVAAATPSARRPASSTSP